MNSTVQHFDLSHAIADSFDTTLRNSAAVQWKDLCVASPLTDHPQFGLVVQGDVNKRGTKGFYVSLRQNFTEETLGKGNEILGAFAPMEAGYEPLISTLDKVQDYLVKSLREPAAPIHTDGFYKGYSKDIMQPLLDALMADDFALAAELTPAKLRLCGYEEITEEYEHTTYGHGWAGQYETTVIAPGRYPVFAAEYDYVENEEMYSNKLKDFRGIEIYLAGKCIADSAERSTDAFPYDNTLFLSPYCHATASSILDGKSSIRLIPPFKAEPVDFQSVVDGEMHRTYRIVDESLPERMNKSPSTLCNKGMYFRKTLDLSEGARRLYDRFLRDYTSSIGSMCNNSQIPIHYLRKDDNYSPEALQELLDTNKIQRKHGEVEAYELTAQERLDLFRTGQLGSGHNNGLALDREYERCKKEVKEAEKKPSLSAQISNASAQAQKQNVQQRTAQPVAAR